MLNQSTMVREIKVCVYYTFGEHLKCIPGTGRVVMYIVIHRYR